MSHSSQDDQLEPLGFDPLQQAVHGASWPEMDAERVDRIQDRWDSLVYRRQVRRRRMALGVAVLILLVGWTSRVAIIGPRHSSDSIVTRPIDSPSVNHGQPSIEATVRSSSDADCEATEAPVAEDSERLYQRAVIVALNHRMIQSNRQRATRRAGDRRVERMIQRLASCPDTELPSLISDWPDEPVRLEARLVAAVQRTPDRSRLAAIRLLAHVASYRSLPLLRQLSQWPEARDVTVIAMARLANPAEIYRLALAAQSESEQSTYASALLSRPDAHSLALYLKLVHQPQTSRSALAAVRATDALPISDLFDMLQSSRVMQRVAASKTLAQIDDPRVSQHLIQMVAQDAPRSEALMTLARRSDPVAQQFMQAAEGNLLLAASARAARNRVDHTSLSFSVWD